MATPAPPGFDLDPRLADESIVLDEWDLCRVLLRDEHRFPWLVLVPRRAGLTELFDLSAPDQSAVMAETVRAARALAALPGVDKVNTGALGNIVRQLHIHVVGRREGDPAWPGPVWGFGPRQPHPPGALETVRARLMPLFKEGLQR